jgi:cell filamentation protein
MVGDPYEAIDDPACYPGTTVLRNLAEIRDADELSGYEAEVVALRRTSLPEGDFDVAHYRAIHRHLFHDVYAWAGEVRTIRTGKGGNWFAFPEHIDASLRTLFKRLTADPFLPGSDVADFIPAAADFIGELNAIHAFREGNGRTQLFFLRMLGQRAGHLLRIESIEPEEFLHAMIESFHCRPEALIDELERLLV